MQHRADKEKKEKEAEIANLQAECDDLHKQKANLDKTLRMLDEQLGDSNSKCATMETNLRELADKYNK